MSNRLRNMDQVSMHAQCVVMHNVFGSNQILRLNPLLHWILILMHQQQTAFKNIVEKEEIARHEQFLLFPQCFPPNQIIVSLFVHIFDIISLFSAESEEPKIDICGKGLKLTWVEFFDCQSILCISKNHATQWYH